MTSLLLRSTSVVCIATFFVPCCSLLNAQRLLQPFSPDSALLLLPADDTVLDTDEAREDLPCAVRPIKPELGFDLKFHTGYTVKLRMEGFPRSEGALITIFHVRPASGASGGVYFVDRFQVPESTEERRGEANLQGAFDVGEGDYHVDWLMRDGLQRVCSSHWDISARLSYKQRGVMLQLAEGRAMPSVLATESFRQPIFSKSEDAADAGHVSVIANFGSRTYGKRGALPRDLRAVVSALQTITHEPRMGGFSLTVVDIVARRIVYTNKGSGQVDWLTIGESLNGVDSLKIDAKQLAERNGEAEFLASVAVNELSTHPSALIFISPKLTSEIHMPKEVLERFSGEECPVFYMSIDAEAAKDPFRDLIASTTKHLKGVVYTIRQPEDLVHAWNDMSERLKLN